MFVMSDLVPEEAIAAIAAALCVDHGHSRQDGGMNCRTCSRRARVAAEAAAPLILAAGFDRLADTLMADAEAHPHGGYYDGMSEAAGIVRDRAASVLRGEGDRDA